MEQVDLNIRAQDFAAELVRDDVELLMLFDTKPIKNELTGIKYDPSENINYDIVDGVIGNGMKLQPDVNFSIPLTINNKFFTIAFWLQSSYIQPSVNSATGLSNYNRIALFDKSDFYFDSSLGYTNTQNGTFVIYEESRENNKNVLRITLVSSDAREVTVETPEYDTGMFHHFWISYLGDANILQVFIDGKIVELLSEDGSQIPKSLFASETAKFHINKSALGYRSLLKNNSGVIDDLIIINNYIVDENIVSKVINNGAYYYVDESVYFRDESHMMFAYDDPTNLGVVAVAADKTNVYLGRTDGVVMKGDQTIWQVKKDYSNPVENNYIRRKLLTAESYADIRMGKLQIYRSIVRI